MDIYFENELFYNDKKHKNTKIKNLVYVENLLMFMKNNKDIKFTNGKRNKDMVFWLKDNNGNEYRQIDDISNKEELKRAFEVGNPVRKTQLNYNLSRYYYNLVVSELKKEFNEKNVFQYHLDSAAKDYELFKGLLESPKLGYSFNNTNSNKIYRNVTHLDVNSMYSFIMKSFNFPSKFERVQKENYKVVFEKRLPFFGEIVIKVKNNDEFLSKLGDYNAASRELKGYFNNIDFDFLKELVGIEKISILKLWVVKLSPMKESVVKAINYAYEKKKEFKGQPERTKYKLFLERLYGNCLKARFHNFEYVFNVEKQDFERKEKFFNKEVFESDEFQNEKMKGYFDYAWGIWITSYARLLLLKAKNSTNAIYGDVDCLIIQGNHKFKIGEEIGEWKIENYYKELKIVDLKWYCGINNNDQLKVTCSGANKERVLNYLNSVGKNINYFCKEMPVECFKQLKYDKVRDVYYYDWYSGFWI